MQPTPPHHLDPRLNHIPQEISRIHLIAICGTGMGALALMLKDAGYEVSGSDAGIYPPMSDLLAKSGITLYKGFHKDHLKDAELVVVGNAVRKENAEALAVGDLKLPYCSFPQAVQGLFGEGKKTVVVAGTHGKTTTSSMMAWVLEKAGLDPTFMIGGVLQNFSRNCKVGRGEYLVVEGDEYDTAFFDKYPKFLHYTPCVTLLTSVEFDHADIYRDLDHVREAFRIFLAGHDAEAAVVACSGSGVSSVAKAAPCDVIPYGEKGIWRAEVVSGVAPEVCFDVRCHGVHYGRFTLPMPGGHNVENALAVVAACHRLGIPKEKVASGLASFKGVKRRQEVKGEVEGVLVLDDFAHHPTAVKSTLKAVCSFYKGRRVVAIFEPRTNSSMRDVFQEAYTEAFEGADEVLVRMPPNPEKVPRGERFSSDRLVASLCKRGKRAKVFENADAIVAYLGQSARSGDLLLVMSNGGFEGIHQKLLDRLGHKK